jgi:hypothetical protein
MYIAEIRSAVLELYMRTNKHDEASWHIAATYYLRLKESKVIPAVNEDSRNGNEWRIGAMQP